MSKPDKHELNDFDELITLTESERQLQRIDGRLRLKRFVEQHGKDKCDAMFAELTKPKKQKR